MKEQITQRRIFLFILGILFVTAALLVGIEDNLPGIALLYCGSIVLVLIFTLTWNKVGHYLRLLLWSILGSVLFVILHNLMYGLGEVLSIGVVADAIINGLGVIFFFMALIVSPSAIVIGLVGMIVYAIKKRSTE